MYLLLTEQGSAVPREAFANDLAKRLELEPTKSQQVLDRLVATGNLRTLAKNDAELIELTPAGQSHFAHLRQAVGQVTHHLIGHLDPHDVATTLKVLNTVNERAENP